MGGLLYSEQKIRKSNRGKEESKVVKGTNGLGSSDEDLVCEKRGTGEN